MKWVLLLSLVCSTLSAESLYVVQSHAVDDLYGASIIHEIKKRRPNTTVHSIVVRSFDQDRYGKSKIFTEEAIRVKAKSHDNLVLLGYDVGSLNIAGKQPVYLPVLVDSPRSSVNAETIMMALSRFGIKRPSSSSLSPTIYTISDKSNLSQLRFRQLREELLKYKHIKLEPFVVKDTADLRRTLLQLNSVTRQPAVLFNNVFTIRDSDSLKMLYYSDVELLVAKLNTRNPEIGVYSPNHQLLLGIGFASSDLADAVSAILDNPDKKPKLHISIGINLKRVDQLDRQKFFLKHDTKIDKVNVD